MVAEATIGRATEADAHALAAKMRPVEVAEVLASSGLEPLPAILRSLAMSTEAWALYFDGEIVCIWGICALQAGVGRRVGAAWLLTTDQVERHPKPFWRLCRSILAATLNQWDELVNAIDARHVQAVRWAKRLGMRLEEAAPFGVAQLPFHRFAVTREDLHV